MHFTNPNQIFPKATFLVNLVGALLIGLFVGYQLKHPLNDVLYLLLVTGFCGGFSTFSALSLEAYQLWKAEQWTTLGLYLGGSLILGTLLSATGIYITQKL